MDHWMGVLDRVVAANPTPPAHRRSRSTPMRRRSSCASDSAGALTSRSQSQPRRKSLPAPL